MLNDNLLRTLLLRARRIAIIGAKDKPGQPVDTVGRYLLKKGYKIFPVHPVRTSAWGIPTTASITEIRAHIDIVVLFRNPDFCPQHAREIVRMAPSPELFWMQTGIRSPECHTILAGTGIQIVEDACIMVEHNRLTTPQPIDGQKKEYDCGL